MFLKFEIDDNEYFKQKWRNEGIPENNINTLMSQCEAPHFQCVLTLYGRENKLPRRIKLTDVNGRELSIGECSEYEISIIEICKKYFKSPHKFTRLPFGVVNVKQIEINQKVG